MVGASVVDLKKKSFRIFKTTVHSWRRREMQGLYRQPRLTSGVLPLRVQGLEENSLHICHLDVKSIICIFLSWQPCANVVALVMRSGQP